MAKVLTIRFTAPKPRDPVAASLAAPQFRPKTVADKRRRTGRMAKHKGGAE